MDKNTELFIKACGDPSGLSDISDNGNPLTNAEAYLRSNDRSQDGWH